MSDLIRQLATIAANEQMEHYYSHMSKGKQLAMWQRCYDSNLACLFAYDDIRRAQQIRTMALVSEN